MNANFGLAVASPPQSIGVVYYSLGSTLFCYLLLKSQYVPKVLAWWGLISSFVALVSTLAIIVGIFEIVTGFWLLVAGIRIPRNCAGDHGAAAGRAS